MQTMNPHLFSGSHDAMSYCLDITSPLIQSESDTFRFLDGVFCCFTRPAIRRWATTQAGIYSLNGYSDCLQCLIFHSRQIKMSLIALIDSALVSCTNSCISTWEKCICIISKPLTVLQTGAKHCGATYSRHSILRSSNCPQTGWFFQWALLHACNLHACNGHCKYVDECWDGLAIKVGNLFFICAFLLSKHVFLGNATDCCFMAWTSSQRNHHPSL